MQLVRGEPHSVDHVPSYYIGLALNGTSSNYHGPAMMCMREPAARAARVLFISRISAREKVSHRGGVFHRPRRHHQR